MGKRKVSSRKRKKVEYRRTEGDPRNTLAPFHLQDFKMWKLCTVLLLLALPPTVNSNETPTPRMCAVCLEKDCANGVRIIYQAGSDTPVWVKANSPTEIQTCSMENLKPGVPCKMANGSLVLPADNPLRFEGIDTYDVRRIFHSQILPCDELNLPPSSTPSPAMCAVCLDKDCATGVSGIYPPDSDTAIWPKANSRTGIQNCSMENLKADAPCKMANGSLVLPANETLRFEGTNHPNTRRIFHSQSFPCADLINSKPSPVTKTPIHNTPTPAAPNISVADNKGIIISGVIGSIIIIFIVSIGVLIWKRKSRGQGQDRVPAHDAEDRNENTMEKQRLNVEDENENANWVH